MKRKNISKKSFQFDSVSTYYDSLAEGYDQLYAHEQSVKLYAIDEHCSELLKHLKKSSLRASTNTSITKKTLLDVGCGSGISTRHFLAYGFVCIGVDPSKKLLEIAQNQANNNQNNNLQNNQNNNLQSNLSNHSKKHHLVSYVHGRAERLPYKKNFFDIVVSLSAIQNFTDAKRGLQEMNRVAKNVLILSVMNRANNFSLIHKHILQIFTVTQEFEVLNDTVFVCEKKN